MSRLFVYVEAFKWLLRLPFTFSIPFILLSIYWVVWGFDSVVTHPLFATLGAMVMEPIGLDKQHINSITQVVDSLFRIIVFLAGILLAYNIAVFLNNRWYNGVRRWFYKLFDVLGLDKKPPAWFEKLAPFYFLDRELNRISEWVDEESKPMPEPAEGAPKIGIILAGGGAKGSYQAGAMKAIYEYLEENNLLSQVRMIAGTSIGSWNALFWLAGLVKPLKSMRGKSLQQFWWEHISINSLITPWYFVPFFGNSLVSANPWKRQFDEIFCNHKDIKEKLINTKIRFYFTKTNIASGRLEFTTNNPGNEQGIPDNRINALLPYERTGNESVIPKYRYTFCNKDNEDYLEEIKNGIFASMTFPPLIPPQENRYELFEDGGVVDNLPVYFGVGVEECDLLFVLPLNADFGLEKKEINTTSMVARLMRVMHVRQGVLERQALKQVQIYNELAEAESLCWALKNKKDELKKKKEAAESLILELQDQVKVYAQASNETVPQFPGPIHTGPSDPSPGDEQMNDWTSTWGYEKGEQGMNDYFEEKKKYEQSENLKPISVFAVCPHSQLIINTIEFWKASQAEEAFDLMYRVTKPLLYKVKPGETNDSTAPTDPNNEEDIVTLPSKKVIRLYKITSYEGVDFVDLWDSPI